MIIMPPIAAGVIFLFIVVSLFISQTFSASVYCFALSLCLQTATSAYIQHKAEWKKIKIITTLIAGLYFTTGEAQSLPAVPRLVVNITIDQLRTDYMEAFSPFVWKRRVQKAI